MTSIWKSGHCRVFRYTDNWDDARFTLTLDCMYRSVSIFVLSLSQTIFGNRSGSNNLTCCGFVLSFHYPSSSKDASCDVPVLKSCKRNAISKFIQSKSYMCRANLLRPFWPQAVPLCACTYSDQCHVSGENEFLLRSQPRACNSCSHDGISKWEKQIMCILHQVDKLIRDVNSDITTYSYLTLD